MIISELKIYIHHDPAQEVYSKDDFFLKRYSLLKEYLNNPIQHETLNGLFLVQNKYGRTFVNKLKIFSEDFLFLNDHLNDDEDVQGLLIHKYLNDEELKYIQIKFEKNPSFKLYIIAHYYYDFIKVYEQCYNYINNKNAIEVMVSSDRSDKNIINIYNLTDYFKQNKNILLCVLRKDVTSVREQSGTKNRTEFASKFPYFLLNFIKYLINPLNEFKKIPRVTKNIKYIYLNRIFELFSVFKYILINTVVAFYFFNKKISGFFKICLIKIIFLIRHILLMSHFKTYGVVVDIYHATQRTFIYSFNFCLYSLLMPFYYKVLLKGFDILKSSVLKYHRFIYYLLLHKLYYLVLVKYGLRFFYKIVLPILYRFRHILLMALFKTYGMMVDFAFFIHRFVTLILPYPLFKIYWFCSFQYNKRLKKILGYTRE